MPPCLKAPTRPPAILVVDDSSTIRSIIQVYLMSLGAEFTEAADGERALQLSRLLPFSLIIADVNMPKLDGVSFLRKLRALPGERYQKVPVVLLTASREISAEAAQEVGASELVRKPVTGNTLLEVVSRALARARAA